MKAELEKNVLMGDYLDYKAVNKSLLLEMIKNTPWHAWNEYLNPDNKNKIDMDEELPYLAWWKRETKPHFQYGTALHAFLLEEENFDKYVAVRPDIALGSNANKALFNEFIKENQGKAFITEKKFKDIKIASKNVLSSKTAPFLLDKSGFVESCIFWDCPETGVRKKCRPDFMNPDMDIVVDVKTADNARHKEFTYKSRGFGYHLSHALTAEGYEQYFGRPLKAYIYLVIEKKTNQVAFYNSEPDCLMLGQEIIKEQTAIYAECVKNDYFPSYEDKILPLNLTYEV